MKRIIFALLAAVVLVGLFTPNASAASGDSARKKNAACVTKAEYKKVKRGHTLKQVKKIFGTNGRTSSTMNSSYTEWVWGDYVEGHDESYWVDGYWSEYATWIDGTWDDEGNYTEGHYEPGMVDGYWDSYYVDGYWEDDYSYNVSQWDSFRDYKKCKSWNHGRGRVAINFDNYSSRYSGYRVYSKYPSRPWIWDALNLRTTSHESILGDKTVPDAAHTGPSNHDHEVTPEPAQPPHKQPQH
jgi:hypothetical protein